MMMSAGAGAARPTGSSTTDRKICSTDSGGACSRSFSAAAAAALNDHQNLAALTGIAAPTRARERGARRFQRALTQSDLLEPPGRRCGCWSTSPFRFSGLVRRFWFGATMELGLQIIGRPLDPVASVVTQDPAQMRLAQDDHSGPSAIAWSYIACAAMDRKRRMARPKNKPPISATMRNCGQTTSMPAPR